MTERSSKNVFDWIEWLSQPIWWPRWLRRTFVLTLPVSFPAYIALMFTIVVLSVCCMPFLWVWIKIAEMWDD